MGTQPNWLRGMTAGLMNAKEELFNLWWIAVTSDLRIHESTNVPYITVTVHYLNDKWELCNKILATRVMDEKKIAENI